MSQGSFGFAWIHSHAARGRVHLGSLRCGQWASGSVGLSWVHSGTSNDSGIN